MVILRIASMDSYVVYVSVKTMDVLKLLRGFFLFVIFVCKRSLLSKLMLKCNIKRYGNERGSVQDRSRKELRGTLSSRATTGSYPSPSLNHLRAGIDSKSSDIELRDLQVRII